MLVYNPSTRIDASEALNVLKDIEDLIPKHICFCSDSGQAQASGVVSIKKYYDQNGLFSVA